MKIKILKGKEIQKTRALYEEVFQDSREYTDYFYEKIQMDGICFAMEKNNEIISELFLIPKRMVYDDKIIDALYVYGVATKEQYRGQGCMDKLMKQALYYAKDGIIELLYLIPVSSALYERYGFHTVKQGEIRMWKLSERESTEMTEYNFEQVFEFYDELYWKINRLEKNMERPYGLRASSSGVYPFRDKDYLADRICRARIEGGGMYLVGKQKEEIEGFIITGEEQGEIVIMDVIGEYEKKEKFVKNFMKWQNRKKIKEYIFTIMIKELKGSLKNITWAAFNDEI